MKETIIFEVFYGFSQLLIVTKKRN